MEIYILRDVRLLCPCSKPSTGGAEDHRFLPLGNTKNPTFRPLPVYKSVRQVHVCGKEFEVICVVRGQSNLSTCFSVLLSSMTKGRSSKENALS